MTKYKNYKYERNARKAEEREYKNSSLAEDLKKEYIDAIK